MPALDLTPNFCASLSRAIDGFGCSEVYPSGLPIPFSFLGFQSTPFYCITSRSGLSTIGATPLCVWTQVWSYARVPLGILTHYPLEIRSTAASRRPLVPSVPRTWFGLTIWRASLPPSHPEDSPRSIETLYYRHLCISLRYCNAGCLKREKVPNALWVFMLLLSFIIACVISRKTEDVLANRVLHYPDPGPALQTEG